MDFATEAIEQRVLEIERLLNAQREMVWRAWTEPRHIVRWWGPSGFTVPVCDQDFRVGGKYHFCMRAPDGTDHWVWGEYVEIVEPEKLVFTWQRMDQEGLRRELNNLVTVRLTARDAKTLLNLHHSVFQTVADRDDHFGGWKQCLDRLRDYVTRPV